ncbi:MAG: aconitate hydratase [Bacteroidota bacterium]|nr:aconitate hydratase [Bacteroidota bacterium]MDP4234181.1 aconitate hydratase [Bacteroidota bacterium]MDP4243753.1 aconitate hydratase [Bacteroidota bacterium]MDP4287882.1 aconitate hydratase [Bacteroidota bacterium]
MAVETTPAMVERVYQSSEKNIAAVRTKLKRPLTLGEKIVFGHLADPETQSLERGKSFLRLMVDRVIMQDATAQMAILQFMQAGKFESAVPASVHCDHLIQAYEGSAPDLGRALDSNSEVYNFLKSACSKYGIGFWGPGSGIIHQVVLENYAFPGGLIIGSDSHTPNMGGLSMVAIGVGGADTVDAMAGFAWEVLNPKLVGVRLTGELSGWAAPKDIILHVAGKLTVKGGTNRIIEYFGPGCATLSTTGKATVTNMGAEIGATTSVFPFDQNAVHYLNATSREELGQLAIKYAHLLVADPEVEREPEKYFDEILEINLSELEPLINGPFTPDLARPVSQLAKDAKENDYPAKVSVTLVGSCTNSSYEDLSRAAKIAEQARAVGARVKMPFFINPGSAQIRETIERDGQLEMLEAIGGEVMANACGPCIGQWKRDDIKKGDRNTIISSYNRNFPGRNDANPATLAFVASPEVVIAYALAGDLSVNPLKDELTAEGGKKYRLTPPPKVEALPALGYAGRRKGYMPPALDPSNVSVTVPGASERLQILQPFRPMVDAETTNLPVLIKTKGKTTTDHISPAGTWLRFRGHLDKISDNMLTGAINAWTGETGTTTNMYTHEKSLPVPQVARDYKARGKRWIVIGDENYGEGSSREHAAMSPRYLGCLAVVARSFARIHESNLKKQGILPLTFIDPKDYDKIKEGDTVSFEYLKELDPVRTVNMKVAHKDGTSEVIALAHTMNMEHIAWFEAGSALNLIRLHSGESSLSAGVKEAPPEPVEA